VLDRKVLGGYQDGRQALVLHPPLHQPNQNGQRQIHEHQIKQCARFAPKNTKNSL